MQGRRRGANNIKEEAEDQFEDENLSEEDAEKQMLDE